MAKKSVGDILGLGLVLISIFITIISLRETNVLIKLTGLIGGIIVIIAETFFLYEIWKKNV